MAEQHHGVIRATVNNEVYEIRIFRSQLSPDTYLFLMHDQDKEVMVNKRLQQARREYDKNVQARKLMLHNTGIELNQPVRQMHDLVERLRDRPDEQQQQALLGQLTAESASVLGLIDNITLLTRLETGTGSLRANRSTQRQWSTSCCWRPCLPSIRRGWRCSSISSWTSSRTISATPTRFAK